MADAALFAPVHVVCTRPDLAYTVEDAQAAWDSWGANCGPWALAAALGINLEEVRGLLPAFARRRYTTELDMRAALVQAKQSFVEEQEGWPAFGLVRVAFHGPWWDDPVPYARLYHSHWIATHDGAKGRMVFDGNAIASGGWITPEEWTGLCLPHLLAACEPEASGAWRVVDRFSLA